MSISKQNSVHSTPSRTNPFDSDSESETSSRPSRASSVPTKLRIPHVDYGENGGRGTYSSSSKNRLEIHDSKGFESQSVQELENYGVHRSQQTTQKVNDCVRTAEVIREDAAQILVTLHRQGEQVTRTHQAAADIEHDLTVSEKLLGSLGGLFSKTWRPKKIRQIRGPTISQDNSFASKANHMEQRQRLGISSTHQGSSNALQHTPKTAMEKIHVEKGRQDDALGDLSNLLGELKGMALDMGTEIDRQNKSLDMFHDDADELNYRVKGANQRGRRLLGK